MPIGLDKGLLVNVLGVLLVAKHVQRQPQHALVVPPHQSVERSSLALLRLANQLIVLDALLRARLELRLRQLAAFLVPGWVAAFAIAGKILPPASPNNTHRANGTNDAALTPLRRQRRARSQLSTKIHPNCFCIHRSDSGVRNIELHSNRPRPPQKGKRVVTRPECLQRVTPSVVVPINSPHGPPSHRRSRASSPIPAHPTTRRETPAGSPPTATVEPVATPVPPATAPSSRRPRRTSSPSSASSSASAPTTTPSTPASSPCLQYALDHHHPRLRVVSDSELMVKQIQGKYKVNSPDLQAPLAGGQKPHRPTRRLRDLPRPPPQKQGRRPPRQPGHGPRHEAHPTTPVPQPARAEPAPHKSHQSQPYPTKSEAPPNPYAQGRHHAPRLHQRRRSPHPRQRHPPRRRLRQNHPRIAKCGVRTSNLHSAIRTRSATGSHQIQQGLCRLQSYLA